MPLFINTTAPYYCIVNMLQTVNNFALRGFYNVEHKTMYTTDTFHSLNCKNIFSVDIKKNIFCTYSYFIFPNYSL